MHSLSKTGPVGRLFGGPVDLGVLGQCGPLLLRLIVGYGFIVHGYAKLARGPETFAVVLHTLGAPLPLLLAWLTVLVELLGGIAILIGAFVPIVSLPMAVVLSDRFVHDPSALRFLLREARRGYRNGDQVRAVGYEIILLYLASLFALVLGGAGPLSVDQWRLRRRTRLASPPNARP